MKINDNVKAVSKVDPNITFFGVLMNIIANGETRYYIISNTFTPYTVTLSDENFLIGVYS